MLLRVSTSQLPSSADRPPVLSSSVETARLTARWLSAGSDHPARRIPARSELPAACFPRSRTTPVAWLGCGPIRLPVPPSTAPPPGWPFEQAAPHFRTAHPSDERSPVLVRPVEVQLVIRQHPYLRPDVQSAQQPFPVPERSAPGALRPVPDPAPAVRRHHFPGPVPGLDSFAPPVPESWRCCHRHRELVRAVRRPEDPVNWHLPQVLQTGLRFGD